ncbi:MAG: carboxypeptidase-like regulatory domain-containing protein, partial [Bacteroidota bacterium]|nr:carboxypeptidase-like regulatory domain-containing protein [Bacteroidota bacterium]
IGCKGDNGADGATGLRGAGGPDKVGSIGGYVFLKDTANTFLLDRRGVISSLEGFVSKADTSDSTGHWQIDSVVSGTYTVVFSKLGFSTAKNPGLQFVGNGTMYSNPTLFQITNFTVTFLDTMASGDSTTIGFKGNISLNGNGNRSVYFFFSSDSNKVTSNNYSYLATALVNQDTTTFTLVVNKTTLTHAGLVSGAPLYITAYGMNRAYQSELFTYIDPKTGAKIYPGLSGTAKTLKFSW